MVTEPHVPDRRSAAAAVPSAPAGAAAIFGARLEAAAHYVDLLATAGVERGLLGPREVPQLWDRHLLNCAVVGELIPLNARVLDVGSGAGLPGIPLALARPDLGVTLLEPMARRVNFLVEAVRELALTGVEVRRGRAEDLHASGRRGTSSPDAGPVLRAEIVTARALAPLDRLVSWCLPLVSDGGRLLAIKGKSAQAEFDRWRDAVSRAGGTRARIRSCGVGSVDPPTTVVEIVRRSAPAKRPTAR